MTGFSNMLESHLQGVEWSLNSTLSMLWRRWQLMLLTMMAIVGLAMGLLLLTPAQYTAETMLQINTRHEQVTNVSDVLSGLASSDAAIRTEMDVLRSRKLAARVIGKLNLLDNAPEIASGSGVIGNLKKAVVYFILPNREGQNRNEGDAKLTRGVDNFLHRLDVNMLPRSYSIRVTYTSRSPELASKVANAVALEYLNSQLEDKFDATRRASDWMSARLKELRNDVYDAELAVQKFRESHNLTQAKGVTLTEQQLSELNSQLILARTQEAEAEAKLSQSQKMASSGRGIETTSEVLNSPLIQHLREQETEVRRKMSDLSAKYGEKHPRMQTVRSELADVRRKINEETMKIQGSLGNDVAVAKARVKTLEDQLAQLQQKTSLSSDAGVQLGELERQAEAERNLYQNFLSRSKEIAQMDFAQTDARIIYTAETPLKPSKPNKLVWLMFALILGTGTSITLALLLEALDSGFRTLQQIENAIGLPALGMLGELPSSEKEPAYYVTRKPTGAFTEGIRAIRTAMQFSNPDKQPKVVMVSSSVPGEGKSIFSISLAQTAAMAGQKVLLIEGDLRRPTLGKQLGLTPKVGLAELLTQDLKLKDVLLEVKTSKLQVLPAVGQNQFAQEILSSEKMKNLMADLRKQYDFIVIDSPPVMAVADAIIIAEKADALLFAVRWGTTPRPLVTSAIKSLKAAHAPLAGAVLTRVDLEKQKAYGYGDYGYYYGKYKEYYTD